jgi:hypothetical protein
MGCDQAKKWPSENGSENKSANVHFRLLMCAIVLDCRAANDPAMMLIGAACTLYGSGRSVIECRPTWTRMKPN